MLELVILFYKQLSEEKMKKLILILMTCILATMAFAQEAPIPVDNWTEQYYAPYIYMARYPVMQLADVAGETGIRYFSLAFILANYQCEATWNGTAPVARSYITDFLVPDLEALRELGGDVIISFGGAGGTDLGVQCEDVDSLVEQYQSVIDMYDVTHLDFDIEGDDIRDEASLIRRFEAIAQLIENNREMGRELVISMTLPVRPTGLTNEGIAALELARDTGVIFDVVNIMTMNFGEGFPPDEMGENTIQSAESLFGQLTLVYPDIESDDLWGRIGLTPMVGINDRQREVFQLDDAEMITEFASEQGISLLAIWSLDRDAPCERVNTLTNDCSGTEQDLFGFSEILNQINE